MSSYAEMSFLKPKITKYSRVKKICFEIGRYGVLKIHNFTLISKWGFFLDVSSSVQKLEPNNSIF
jgi:hypothetical protein